MPKVHVFHADTASVLFSALESFPYPTAVIDPAGLIVCMNGLFARRFGMKPSECVGRDIFALVSAFLEPERVAFRREACAEVWQSGKSVVFEECRDDNILKITITPFRSGGMAISHLMLIIEDVTMQRRTDESLERSRMRFARAMELVKSGIWEANLKSGENLWSDTTWKLYGLQMEVEPASTELWARTIHPDDREATISDVEAAVRNEAEINIEYRVIHPDASVHWLLVRGVPLQELGGDVERYIGIVIDITERKRAELEAAKFRRHMVFALDKTHVGVWDLNLRDRSAQRTLEASRIFGYEMNPPDWSLDLFLDHVFPDDRAMVQELISSSIKQQKDYAFECRIGRSEGEIRWISVQGIFHRDRSGDEHHVLGIVQDITERRQAEEERERMQAQLLHSQKLELIGQLAGGIAHDFNNHLTAILGNLELAINQLAPAHPVAVYLEHALQTALRSAELTRQLLGFARKQTVKPRVVDLKAVIDELLPMLVRLVGSVIRFEWRPALQPILVSVDPSQLDQILTNLCVNARDAMTGPGQIILDTALVQVSKAECQQGHICHLPGDYARIAVTDTGSGIDPKNLPHIFEPFFTTKERGKGTGLGLATVYGIVKQNKGYIDCESVAGKGTTFNIYLPQYHEPGNEPQASLHGVAGAERKQLILLVEDEAEVLSLVRSILETRGYRVITAADAEEAMKIAGSPEAGIDLLLTDIRLPGMNGIELQRRLEERYPGLKTLFMSAYASGSIDISTGNGHKVNFISKPFIIEDLLEAVRKTIGTATVPPADDSP